MADSKVFLPQQTTRRGKAGYKGKDVVVVDPKSGQPITKGKVVKGQPGDSGAE